MINIGILEDDLKYRRAFVRHCQKSSKLNCSLAIESAELLEENSSKLKNVDIMIIDLELPGLDGFEATRLVKKMTPETPVIVLSVHQDYEATFKALKNGAIGYLVKKLDLLEIEELLVDFHDRDRIPLSPQIARRILQYFQASPAKSKLQSEEIKLSPKEILTIKHTTKGHSAKETAALMSISEHGVRFHIKNIYKKLHIKSKGELMNLYVEGFFSKYFTL